MAVSIQYQGVAGIRDRIHVPTRVKIVGAALFAILLISKVWVRIQITAEGYNLAEQRSRTVDLDMQKRELELKLSILKRRDHLIVEARERLNLREPTKSEVWKVVE